MSNLPSNRLIQQLSEIVASIRNKLTIFGFSDYQINQMLKKIINIDEEYQQKSSQINKKTNQQMQLSLDEKNKQKFENALRRYLTNHQKDIQGVILALIAKLQIYLSQIEQLQTQDLTTLEKKYQQALSQESEAIILKQSTKSMSSQKESNLSSTEGDSLQAHQAKLQSLEILLSRTQMLRSLLKYQMRVSSIGDLSRLSLRSYPDDYQQIGRGYLY